jgi:preprotein translocase subunit Sec63
MEMFQHIIQAIPVGGSLLQQLPGIDSKLAQHLEMRDKLAIKGVQDLMRLSEDERRRALESLDEAGYTLAMSIAKQIPILLVSNTHFKGILS